MIQLSDDLAKKVSFAEKQTIVTPEIIRLAMNCLDLTSLKGNETEDDIRRLCSRAIEHKLASVCVYPDHVEQAARFLRGTGIVTATVINFPIGHNRTNSNERVTPKTTGKDIENAIRSGAEQVDIVYPRLSSSRTFSHEVLSAARASAIPRGHVTLKCIFETAAFDTQKSLMDACLVAIAAGVDCLKTSTGKHENGGATLEAAAILFYAIEQSRRMSNVGVKISGGIRTPEQCAQYVALKRVFFGQKSFDPKLFRFGASEGLLDNLISFLNPNPAKEQEPATAY